jgi:hypothetical protein
VAAIVERPVREQALDDALDFGFREVPVQQACPEFGGGELAP